MSKKNMTTLEAFCSLMLHAVRDMDVQIPAGNSKDLQDAVEDHLFMAECAIGDEDRPETVLENLVNAAAEIFRFAEVAAFKKLTPDEIKAFVDRRQKEAA